MLQSGPQSREVGSTEERSLKLANLYAQVTSKIVAELVLWVARRRAQNVR
jgi:hypothetical protein